MSISVGIKQLSDISSNVAFYYSANDINLPVGSDVLSLTSRVGSDACTFFGSTNYGKMQLDEQGFKYITFDATVNGAFYYSNAGKLYTPNNSETFVYVLDNIASAGYHVGFDSAPNFTQLYFAGFSYADDVVGSSRLTYVNAGSTKTIVVARFSSSKMEIFSRKKSVGTILNPVTYTTFTGYRYKLFPAQSGSRHYAVMNIKEYLSDDKMNQLIKLIAFEHGVKI